MTNQKYKNKDLTREKKGLIERLMATTSKESGLCESPSLWTNNSNLIGLLRTAFEFDWQKAED